MKLYFTTLFVSLKDSLFDRINIYLSAAILVVASLDLVMWLLYLRSANTQSSWRLPYSPIAYLGVVLALNFCLSFAAYKKDKNISYLLLSANFFLALIIFILEIYYFIYL